jgi:hypothetical protein
VLALLQRYYPINIQLHFKAYYAIGAGLFVAFFLIYFQPFGAAKYSTVIENIEYMGIGTVVAVVVFSCQALLSLLFSKNYLLACWKTWHQILFNMVTLMFISIGIAIFYWTWGVRPSFLGIFKYVFSIGIFPIIGFTLLDQSFWRGYTD